MMKCLRKEKTIKYLAFLIFAGLFLIGNLIDIKNVSLLAVTGLFLFNIFENLISSKRSIFYIMFHGFVFLFILDRPIISFFRGDEWWYFGTATVYIALFVLLLSLVFLNVGFYTEWHMKGRGKAVFQWVNEKINNVSETKLYKVWFWIVVITLSASLIKEVINLLHHGNYADVYLGVEVEVPIVISLLAGISVFCMFFYLATLPTKLKTVVVLFLYLMTGMPGILTGSRNALMIKALFCLVYFLLRECLEKNSKWIGKREIVAIIIMIPVLMVGLGILNYTRENSGVPSISLIEIGEDFLYKQGTSFDTLCQTIEYRSALRDDNYINYTFGELIDFINYNKISNVIFGTLDFGSGNNIYNGTMSNNLAHRVSYLVLNDSYLTGHGRGTTYFSEIYLDFGYLGIMIFNLLLGLFLSKIGRMFESGVGQRIVLLNCLLYFFMIPRLAFFSIFSFTINYYFWVSVVLWVLLCIWFGKKKRRNK